MTSTVDFPTTSDVGGKSSASIVSRFSISQQTARSKTLDVISLCYGSRDEPEPPAESVSRLAWMRSMEMLYDPNAVYENPCLSAADRGTIMNVQMLIRELSTLDCLYPRLFSLLLRKDAQKLSEKEQHILFRALRIWSEVIEVYDNESFDGSQNSVVEHIVHFLLLPGLHDTGWEHTHGRNHSSDSLLYSHELSASSTSLSSVHLSRAFGGVITRGWSPFHFRIRVTTRLSFNDAGRVVHHRDLIDVKDLVQGFPGGTAFQWITSTLAAKSLSLLSRLFLPRPNPPKQDTHPPVSLYPIRTRPMRESEPAVV